MPERIVHVLGDPGALAQPRLLGGDRPVPVGPLGAFPPGRVQGMPLRLDLPGESTGWPLKV